MKNPQNIPEEAGILSGCHAGPTCGVLIGVQWFAGNVAGIPLLKGLKSLVAREGCGGGCREECRSEQDGTQQREDKQFVYISKGHNNQ